MDISVTTILVALLPVLATMLLCALMVSATVIMGVHPTAKSTVPRRAADARTYSAASGTGRRPIPVISAIIPVSTT